MSNDPKNTEVNLDNLRAAPVDPITGEPQDDKPLYYRSLAKSVIMEDGSTVQDTIDNMKDGLESHTHNASEII